MSQEELSKNLDIVMSAMKVVEQWLDAVEENAEKRLAEKGHRD